MLKLCLHVVPYDLIFKTRVLVCTPIIFLNFSPIGEQNFNFTKPQGS